eukprot:jgi/Hompol1/5618/HPOL_002012-RA
MILSAFVALVSLGSNAVEAAITNAQRPQNKGLASVTTLIIGDPSYDALGSDQLAFGVNMAVRNINSRSDILPDTTILVERYDSNLSVPGTTYREFLRLSKLQKYSLWAGPISTELNEASALFASYAGAAPSLANYNGILAFSPTANNTEFSDKTRFGQFWRYTNPVENSAFPALAFMRYFNWTDLVLTWVEGTEGATVADVFSSNAISLNMTMVAKVPFAISSDKDLYMQALGPLKFIRSTKSRIIVLAGGPSYSIDILLAANRLGMIGNGYVWITLQSGFVPDLPRQSSYWGGEWNPGILRGAMQFSMPRGANTADPNYINNFTPVFQQYLTQVQGGTDASFYTYMSLTNTSSPGYIANAFYSDTVNKIPAFNVLAGYDGVMLAAKAWDNIVNAASANGTLLQGATSTSAAQSLYGKAKLSDAISAASSYSAVSGVSAFTTTGDPGVPYVVSLWSGSSWTASTSMGSYGTIYVPPSGVLSATVNLTLNSFFWSTGGIAASYVPPQYPVLIEDFIAWDTSDTKAILAIYGIFWVFLFATLIVIAIKSSSPDVKNISPNYISLLTIGLMIASLNILTLPGKYKPIGCTWRPWPLSLGMAIVLITILAKAHHIYYVYDNVELFKLPSLLFNSPKLFLLVGAVVIANGAILAAYSGKAPLVSGIVYDDLLNKNTYACIPADPNTTLSPALIWLAIAFNLILLAATILFAFWIRNAPVQMGNSKQLGYVVYISALLSLIVMVGGFSGVSTIKTQFFVESIVVLFGLITIYAFLVAAPLFSAVTGYVSKALPGMQSFGSTKGDHSTTSAATGTTSTIQPTARGMRGRKKGSFKISFKEEAKDPNATIQSIYESINGTFHLREGFLQCTTNMVPTWVPVTVTLILEGLNLVICVSGSDDQTTEFNIANLISIEVLEKHPTEAAQNCLVLKQATQTHILQLKTMPQVYVLAIEIAKKMVGEDNDEQRNQLQNSDKILKSVVMVGVGEAGSMMSGSESKKTGSTSKAAGQKKLKSNEDDDD